MIDDYFDALRALISASALTRLFTLHMERRTVVSSSAPDLSAVLREIETLLPVE